MRGHEDGRGASEVTQQAYGCNGAAQYRDREDGVEDAVSSTAQRWRRQGCDGTAGHRCGEDEEDAMEQHCAEVR